MPHWISVSEITLPGNFPWDGRLVWLACTLALTAALLVAAIGGLLRAAHRLRGTTLTAPLWWAALSNLALVPLALAFVWGGSRPDMQQLRFFAGCCSFCPAMALLGAKRPQHVAWQFIVLSLLFVAAIPAVPAWTFQEPLLVHTVWKWFYVVLILLGWLNYVPTPLGFAATLWAVGQGTLLWENLPFPRLPTAEWGPWQDVAPLILIPAAVLAARILRRPTTGMSGFGWNDVWRDFRNAYGIVWAARVIERTNALAQSLGAKVSLDWGGFRAGPDAVGVDMEMAKLEPGFRNLLRRFVSETWIDQRFHSSDRPPTG